MAAVVRDVSLRFGRRWALVHVDLAFESGRTVLLTGENGAGKTTLLRVLATALRPTRGAVELFGQPLHGNLATLRRRVGLMTHQSHIYDDLSARENLELVASLCGCDRARIPPLLERVALGPHAERRVRHFSAGMKRRLALARLLLRDPELVLLDEPFGQLDPEGVELVASVIRELRARGTTMVISTHDIERGLALSDRRVALSAGRVAA
jgi:heme exporter protein A